ncbi:hypothetical protein KKC74_10925, partial [bacterium]|nr:hypothetical protein [bacterium]
LDLGASATANDYIFAWRSKSNLVRNSQFNYGITGATPSLWTFGQGGSGGTAYKITGTTFVGSGALKIIRGTNWTHVYSENYYNIFNRSINAAYIFLLYCMYLGIEINIRKIDHDGIRTYKTTRFFFMYVFRLILDQDTLGNLLVNSPKDFFEQYPDKLIDKFGKLFSIIVHDFNYLIKDIIQGAPYYDYKNELRNYKKVNELAEKVLVDYKKSINRHPEDSFESIIKEKT